MHIMIAMTADAYVCLRHIQLHLPLTDAFYRRYQGSIFDGVFLGTSTLTYKYCIA